MFDLKQDDSIISCRLYAELLNQNIMQFVLWKEFNNFNARIYKDFFYMAKRFLKSQTDLSSAVGFIKYFAQSRTKLNWNPKFLQNENTFNMWNNTFVSFISCFYFQIIRQNIARGTTDPEIDSETWTKLGNNMSPLALIANLATRWRHLTFSH